MARFKIPVTYQMWGVYEVEADSLEKAKAKVLNDKTPLPDNSYYIKGSIKISEDEVNEINKQYLRKKEVNKDFFLKLSEKGLLLDPWCQCESCKEYFFKSMIDKSLLRCPYCLSENWSTIPKDNDNEEE